MAASITRERMIGAFAPAHSILQGAIDNARELTTLERFRELHPEVPRESGLMRLMGQTRWLVVAEDLVAGVPTVDGFGVLSSEAQHNSGQYVFSCPHGAFTVKREPHDEDDPADGRYIQEALDLLEDTQLAEGIDAGAPIKAYLSVTARAAVLKICHPTLSNVMKIPVADLMAPAAAGPQAADRPRARARSTRVAATALQTTSPITPPAQ